MGQAGRRRRHGRAGRAADWTRRWRLDRGESWMSPSRALVLDRDVRDRRPLRNAFVYGVTTSSCVVSITT